MTYEQAVAATMRRCGTAFEHDWFDGEITVSPCGNITPAPDCEWLWIQGSLMNDGLHHVIGPGEVVPALKEETFEGRYWRLKPPSDFLSVCEQIREFSEKIHPYSPISETFVNYSYSNARSNRGSIPTWEEAFASSLSVFSGKRMVPGVFY